MCNQSNFLVLKRNDHLELVAPPEEIMKRFVAETDTISNAVCCNNCGCAWADEIETLSCPCLDE